HLITHFTHAATFTAVEVVVPVRAEQGTDVGASATRHLRDNAILFEPLQGAVDRRIVNLDTPPGEALLDLLAGHMAVLFVKNGQCPASRSGDAMSPGTELFDEFVQFRAHNAFSASVEAILMPRK